MCVENTVVLNKLPVVTIEGVFDTKECKINAIIFDW